MVVDTGDRIHTIRIMSLLRGAWLATTATAAVAARAGVPMRVILPGRGETCVECGNILEDADLSWLPE
jgi:hypothetical protein